MKRLISLWLIISLFSLSSGGLAHVKAKAIELTKSCNKDNYTVLLCGLDDAAGNTDTIILMNYDMKSNCVSFLHIPRDTYFNSGVGQNKINQIAAHRLASGKDRMSAVSELSDKISSALGIVIDGFSAYTPKSIEKIVDAIGGVDIDLEFDLEIETNDGNVLSLKKGTNHLDGSTALAFIRNRKNYQLGDLSRIDAQKLCLSAFIKKLKENFKPEVALRLVLAGKGDIATNINIMDIISLAMKNRGRIQQSSSSFATLPGAAVISDNGISYYSVNKNACRDLLLALPFIKSSDFDRDEIMRKSDNTRFVEIYDSIDIPYKIYRDDELGSIKIYTK